MPRSRVALTVWLGRLGFLCFLFFGPFVFDVSNGTLGAFRLMFWMGTWREIPVLLATGSGEKAAGSCLLTLFSLGGHGLFGAIWLIYIGSTKVNISVIDCVVFFSCCVQDLLGNHPN